MENQIIVAAFAAVKSIGEGVMFIRQSKVDAAVREKTIRMNDELFDLQNKLFQIQSVNDDLTRAKKDLEQKIMDMENWNQESENYALHEIAPGVFVFARKESVKSGEPNPWLCTNCYQNRKRSILQRGKKTYSGTTYFCPDCKTKILDHTDFSDPPSYESPSIAL